jgi:hypothetical protein
MGNREHVCMHEFPPLSELQFLIGKELGQVALDPHSVQFRWSEGGQITVQHDFEHVDEEGRTHVYGCTAHVGPPLLLHRLIQKKVLLVEVQPLCLTLTFEGGQILRLRSEKGPWECGLIKLADDLAGDYIVY